MHIYKLESCYGTILSQPNFTLIPLLAANVYEQDMQPLAQASIIIIMAVVFTHYAIYCLSGGSYHGGKGHITLILYHCLL